MFEPDYTIVCGVDKKHLRQLTWTWATWKFAKPSLLNHPMLVFYDRDGVTSEQIFEMVDHPNLTTVPWCPPNISYERRVEGKFGCPQRYKMLAGFVHVPARYVNTKYWLKIDVDTVANGVDDWIQEEWFDDNPAIISHPWGFTKPPNQMLELDKWADRFLTFSNNPPLNLKPKEGWSRVRHKRIISWVGFFSTYFTKLCAGLTIDDCPYQLPVSSQDGYMWYVAKRLELGIIRTNMKSKGWDHLSSESSIRKSVERVLNNGQ